MFRTQLPGFSTEIASHALVHVDSGSQMIGSGYAARGSVGRINTPVSLPNWDQEWVKSGLGLPDPGLR